MHTFDRYLLREWLQIIGLVVAVLLGVLLIHVVYNELPDLLADEASFGDIALYFGVAIPSFLSVLTPLTLLISLLYVLGQMHHNHEFTALRAAGVSIARITRPIWIVGVFCCIGSWWLNSSVVPWSVERARTLRDEIRFQKQAGKDTNDRVGAVASVTFDNRPAGRMWFMNRYSRYTKRAYGVTLTFLDAQRRETRRLFAAVAWPAESGKGWIFQEGRDLRFEALSGENLSNTPYATLTLPELTEDMDLMLLIDRKPSDLSFTELQGITSHLADTGSPKFNTYSVRYHSLIAGTFAPLIIIGLAIPFAMTGVRVNPAVGISKSIGLFVIYYIFAQLGGSLATKAIVSPMLAAWLPNIGMSGVAFWFLARLR